MSISARELAVLVQGLSYLILTAITARQFLREPGSLRFHTLLVFASASGALLFLETHDQLLAAGAPGVASFLLSLSTISALLNIYALLLLTADLTNIRRWLGWIALGVLILSAAFTLVAPDFFAGSPFFFLGTLIPLWPFAIRLILLASYLFITACFWYSSAFARGAIRYRLQGFAASGVLACCGMTFGLVSLFVPEISLMLEGIEALLVVLTGMLLYLGCAPPGWLRRFWLLPSLEESNQFCNTLLLRASQASEPLTATEASAQSQSAAISQILCYAMNGLGAVGGTVELWNEQTGALEIAASILPSEEVSALDTKSGNNTLLLEVFQTRQALLKRLPGRRYPFLSRTLDAGAALAAPLLREEQALGVIGLCCEHVPDLNERDLARLQLFADQITSLLAHRAAQQEATALKTLRSEQALKDEFIALIAHDLRTPLTVLKGRLQLLRRQMRKEGQEAAAEEVARLDAPYNRLSQLITTLLDVSYIDTGRLQLLRHAVDLIGLVRKVVDAHPGYGIDLEVAGASGQREGSEPGSAEPMIALGDAARLEQALENLLDNARKYSPVGSSITVRLERRADQAGDEEALLSVRDLGIGIPLEDQPRLFGRWFRATSSASQSTVGLGLGLYISHEIITRHGGRLWVESSGVPGEGSTFFFTLALIQPQQVIETGGSATH
ncbi:MAG TPA: ATP-binding protein [Ktedonobacterales bacterium]|jgi:signal transduction histidine kinase